MREMQLQVGQSDRMLSRLGHSTALAALLFGSMFASGSSWAQSAAKPLWPASTTGTLTGAAAEAAIEAHYNTGIIVPDIWAIRQKFKYAGKWLPIPQPVLTTESFQQMRAISCVAELTARRQVGTLALRAKDGKQLQVLLLAFDISNISARGWRVNSSAPALNSYYFTADVANALGLPAVATPGQTVQPLSFAPTMTKQVVQSTGAMPTPEQLMTTKPTASAPASAPRSLAPVPYRGTFDADTKLLNERLTELAVQFEPIFRSQRDKWTEDQRDAQQRDSTLTVYVRTKPGLSATAREACQAQLEAHTKTWEAGLPLTTWSVKPLRY